MPRKIPPEIKALGNRFLPWNDAVTLRAPDGPPKGLRLSEPCGACCILDYFLDRKSFISEGVSTFGHLYADLFIQTLLEPVTNPQVEKVYQWAPKGFSGMDTVVEGYAEPWYGDIDDPYVGHYEYKTTSKDLNPKPTKANREQVIRQRVVMARHYGVTDAELFNSYIFIISKDGKNTGRVSKPFLIDPTADELRIAQRDIDLRVLVYEDVLEDGLEEDPLQHPLLRELRKGSCTRCFPLQEADPSDELTEIFNRGRVDWEDWIEYQRLEKWLKRTKEAVKPLVPLGEKIQTEYFLIRHTETGRLSIDPKNIN